MTLSLHADLDAIREQAAMADSDPKAFAAEVSRLDLDEIAAIVHVDWERVYFGAVPYLDALDQLHTMDDHYGMEDARSIVAYFLSNATSWRGPVARVVKAELKRRLGR